MSEKSLLDNLLDKVTKKELLFTAVVIILVGLIMVTFSINAASNELLVNQISMAGNLASILLAVVAIIYAFFQTSESSKQNELLRSGINELKNKVDEANNALSRVSEARQQVIDVASGVHPVIEKVEEQSGLSAGDKDALQKAREQLENLVVNLNTSKLYRFPKLKNMKIRVRTKLDFVTLIRKIEEIINRYEHIKNPIIKGDLSQENTEDWFFDISFIPVDLEGDEAGVAEFLENQSKGEYCIADIII